MKNRPEDLWKNVAVGALEECWPWLGNCTPNGYGLISVSGRNHGTHRVAYELATGQKPGQLMVLHSCDNPPCCNPAHLHLGTNSDNIREAWARGRYPSRDGELHHLSKLTNSQRAAIVTRRLAGERNGDLAREFGVSPPTVTRLVHQRDQWLEQQETAA